MYRHVCVVWEGNGWWLITEGKNKISCVYCLLVSALKKFMHILAFHLAIHLTFFHLTPKSSAK